MIQVKERQARGGWEIVFSGHAGYAPEGEDIVCAAVSILFFTLAEAAVQKGGRAFFRSGEGKIFVPEELERELSFVRSGISLLAEKYPEKVQEEL